MLDRLKSLLKRERWYVVSTHTEYIDFYWESGDREGEWAGKATYTFILRESTKDSRDCDIEINWQGHWVVETRANETAAKTTKYYNETVIPWLYNSLDRNF